MLLAGGQQNSLCKTVVPHQLQPKGLVKATAGLDGGDHERLGGNVDDLLGVIRLLAVGAVPQSGWVGAVAKDQFSGSVLLVLVSF